MTSPDGDLALDVLGKLTLLLLSQLPHMTSPDRDLALDVLGNRGALDSPGAETTGCGENMFECRPGECKFFSWVCDGEEVRKSAHLHCASGQTSIGNTN